jgi:arylsulfatase A
LPDKSQKFNFKYLNVNTSFMKIFFYKTCTLFSLLVSVIPVFSQTGLLKKTSHPNVIIIYTDDQGGADLGTYGAKDLITPNLDKLARTGTRFTQFYATSAVCSPSRASLLTGRYPQRAGLTGNASNTYGQGGMPGSQFTIAELFKSAGYKTGHIGKWHMGYSPETMPNAQGFDYSFGFMGGCIDNYSHFYYWGGPNMHDLWRNGKEIYEPGKFFPDLMVAEAGKFMAANKANPFLMYFAINMPHYPLQPSVKWIEYYKNLPMPRRLYAAYVSTMDEKIGDLLKKVDALGLRENTIIVFQDDQGHSIEDRSFNGGGSAGQYRGAKQSLFEGGIRVPAFISWPKHVPVNAVRNQFASNVDWFPTLAEYCNITLPNRKIDGHSLVKLIGSNEEKTPHPDFFWHYGGTKENPQWAVRDGSWKLLHSPVQSNPGDVDGNNLMLINLDTDPGESKNVAAQHPDIVQRMKKKYEDWIKEVVDQK